MSTPVLANARKSTTLEDFGRSDTPRAWHPFERRFELSTDAISQEATTLGWDTTFAIRLPDVNKALAKSGTYPKDFDLVIDPDDNYSVKGTFGLWQIARGGDGGIVFMSTPIVDGQTTNGSKSYSMKGATVYISVKLKYIPGKPSGGVADGQKELEPVDLRTDSESRSAEDLAVIVQNMTFDGPPPSILVQALMKGGMQEWFLKNLARFAYVFATVNLNEIAAQGEFQWLKPTYTSYAYREPEDSRTPDTDCLFGVLNMTSDSSPEGLSKQLAPNAISAGQRAGLSISMERFLSNVILPGISKGFEGATTYDFTLSSDKSMLVNTKALKMAPVRVGLIDYTPYVQTFELQVKGEEIQIHTRTSIDISPGIVAWVDTISYQKIVLVTKSDGQQTLDFKESRPSVKNQWIDKAAWVTITEIIVSIVGAVAALVAGNVIVAIIPRVIAIIIILIVAGLAAATPALIALVAGGGAASALPAITLMVANASTPVKWPDSKAFTLTSAGLNGAFQLGGDPNFAF